MITFFRSFFNSRIGVVISLIFLALIAVAFAASDVTGGASFGGVSSESVAQIDGEEIGTGEFSNTVTNAFNQFRQQNPQLDMAAFDAQGGIDGILEQMIGSYATADFADSIGLGASKRLVDSEIAGIQAFKGADGRFDETLFRNALAQQGLTEARVREDIRRGLLSDQLLLPATFGAKLSQQMALPYAGLILEGREGRSPSCRPPPLPPRARRPTPSCRSSSPATPRATEFPNAACCASPPSPPTVSVIGSRSATQRSRRCTRSARPNLPRPRSAMSNS